MERARETAARSTSPMSLPGSEREALIMLKYALPPLAVDTSGTRPRLWMTVPLGVTNCATVIVIPSPFSRPNTACIFPLPKLVARWKVFWLVWK